jgi:hypothetical protein
MSLRRSTLVVLLLITGSALLVASFADASRLRARLAPALALKHDMVNRLQLTDLCLFTEARYTRHPSQADLHSAFMDHPLAFEHFPTGSLISPPAHLIQAYENLDRKTEVSD